MKPDKTAYEMVAFETSVKAVLSKVWFFLYDIHSLLLSIEGRLESYCGYMEKIASAIISAKAAPIGVTWLW